MNWRKKFIGGLAGLLLAGCIDEPFFDKKEDKKIQEGVIELQNSELNKISEISDNSITFNEVKDFERGDIIVGGVSSQTPGGILRKVSTISNGGRTFKTEPTSLEKVFEKDKFSYTHYLDYENLDIEKSLSVSKAKNIKFEPVNNLKSTQKGQGFIFNLSKTIIYDLDGNENTTDDQVWMEGNIYIQPKYELNAEFDKGLKKFEFTPEISKEAHIRVGGKLEKRINQEVTLIKTNFIPITIPGPGVPIVLRPNIEINAGIIGQLRGEFEIEASIIQDTNLKIQYENKKWSMSKDYEKSFEFDEFEGQMNMDYYAYINPRLTVVVNELVGPFVEMSGGLELYANTNDNPWWYLDGKIKVNAGADMNFLSFLIPEYNKNIYEYSKRIAQASGNFEEDNPNEDQNTKPNAYFVISPKEGNLDTEFMFNANSTWDEQNEGHEMYYRWDFDGDGNWDENWKKGNDLAWHYYSQPGEYRAKMQVKDLGDLVDSFESNVKVNRNNEPNKPGEIEQGIYTDPVDGQKYKIMNINGTWWFKENFNRYTPKSRYPESDSIKNHEYGRLYSHNEAIKNCPPGWKLPSFKDWENLVNSFNPDYDFYKTETWKDMGNKLKEIGTQHWKEGNGGEDIIGLGIIGAGRDKEGQEGYSYYFKEDGSIWTNHPYGDDSHYVISFKYDEKHFNKSPLFEGTQCSVRYIKREN